MLKLARFLGKFKKQVIFGPVFKLIEAVFELIVPLIMARMIDVGITSKDVPYVTAMGLFMLLLGVLGIASSVVCQRFAAEASQGFGTELRSAMFLHINRLSHAQTEKFGVSSLTTRLISDVNTLQLAVAMLIRLVVRAPFLAVGAVIMAFFIDRQLSVVFLVSIPIIAVILFVIMKKTVPFYRRIQERLDRLSLLTGESLSGARVIRAFSRRQSVRERFAEASDALCESALSAGRLSSLLNPLTYLVMNAAILAILWFGGIRVSMGELTTGEVIAFVNYMIQILFALIVIANLVALFTRASASAVRVGEVLDEMPGVMGGGVLPRDGGDAVVAFDRVNFSYGEGELALKEITFTVKRGEKIGVIGTTGSGKTTLMNLIPRFYDATGGSVSVCGTDVRALNIKALRKRVGLAGQRPELFGGTIRDNLKIANPDADDIQIKNALDIAAASEFVDKLPDKYDHVVARGGMNLSGGQKQRLCIARAVLARPDILILDDATSALDRVTEAALWRRLFARIGNTAVFVVSQRVHSVRDADKIIVLAEGEVAGMGSHEALYDGCEEYRSICISQEVGK